MKLRAYIDKYYCGIQKRFAAAQVTSDGKPVKPSQVTQWLKMECIVVDHVLYYPSRDLSLGGTVGVERDE
jgi:hypothetical protein